MWIQFIEFLELNQQFISDQQNETEVSQQEALAEQK